MATEIHRVFLDTDFTDYFNRGLRRLRGFKKCKKVDSRFHGNDKVVCGRGKPFVKEPPAMQGANSGAVGIDRL